MAGNDLGRVVILGAGMAGLWSALALAPHAREIVLLERDPPPPPGGAEAVFEGWKRRGASQLRHSHAFLARLRELISRHHPAVLDALKAAGARELAFADALPPALRRAYAPAPEDERMTILICRRSTLEQVIRAQAEAHPGVVIRSGVFVDELIAEPGDDGRLVARGLRLQGGEEVRGDLVIDAGGRGSPIAETLSARGVVAPAEKEGCAILYYTRFYRLRPGQEEPPRADIPGNGDLGYLKFGVFPADARAFSITVAVPEVEEGLRAAVVRPETFDAICARLPGVARWTDPARAEPASRVHAMGDLSSVWRETAPEGKALVQNLFCVGDSLIRTNPLYGRGCAFSAIEAHLLREALTTHTDPDARAAAYAQAVRRDLRPFFEDMRQQDRRAAVRAAKALDSGPVRKSAKARFAKWLETGITVAIRSDLGLMRQAMLAFHMLAPPRAWLKRPAVWAKIVRVLVLDRQAKAALLPLKPGPARKEMLGALGLS